MKRLKRPKKRSSVFASPWVLFLLLFFAGLMLYNAVASFLWQRQTIIAERELDANIEKRESEIKELRDRMQALTSGEGLEVEARRRLNLQKPEEEVLIIVGGEEQSVEGEIDGKTSIWSRIKKLFSF